MILTLGKEDYEVKYTNNAWEITNALAKARAPFFTYDLETTGLHIKKDVPFLGAICFNHQVFVFPTEKGILQHLPAWAKLVRKVVNHNIGFDMHMTANVIGDEAILAINNWSDTMGMCRLVFEAESSDKGGDSLKLKQIIKKYIDRKGDYWEKEVKAWIKNKKAENRKVLMSLLKGFKWTMKKFEEYLKNSKPLPSEILAIYNSWIEEYPEPNYQSVPMEIMLPYVATDVIGTKILVHKCSPVLKMRKHEGILEQESKLLPIIFRMERSGIKVNTQYLQESMTKLENYIEKLYKELHSLTGLEFTASQNKVIKEFYEAELGQELSSTDKAFLKKVEGKHSDDKLGRIAYIIGKLRRFEKWRSTYITKILKNASYDGRFYTSMNPYQPVTGRFSGDAQQFPKDPIYTEEGYAYEKETGNTPPDSMVLYHPRKAFEGRMWYLDYSQVELRVQSHYTIPFGGDTNMLRAYMPYKCRHYKSGLEYRYATKEERSLWSELREGSPVGLHWEEALEKGYSAWINPDTNEPWVPTDVHLATTLKALVAMGKDPAKMEKKDIKWWRKKGKQFNFMRNYGGGDRKAAETLEVSLEVASAMNRGYTDAFPVVVTYQENVVVGMHRKGYVVNIAGRRYYLSDPRKFYKCANYLIQGSCADILKRKMIEIDEFMTANHLHDKLRLFLCVHDELQFEQLEDGVEWAIWKIKEIMEDTPEILVPIVAEVEYTETNWSAKKKVLPSIA
jgi:DNA polymerase-1